MLQFLREPHFSLIIVDKGSESCLLFSLDSLKEGIITVVLFVSRDLVYPSSLFDYIYYSGLNAFELINKIISDRVQATLCHIIN